MAIEATDERMARLERGCERIAERLGLIEHRLTGIEPRLASGTASLRYEVLSALDSLRSDVRTGDERLQKEGRGQFYWLVALLAGSTLLILLFSLTP